MSSTTRPGTLVLVELDELRRVIEEAISNALDHRGASTESDFLDSAGAAEVLNLHPDTVSRMARTGALPSRRIGREYRFQRAELLAWIEANGRR